MEGLWFKLDSQKIYLIKILVQIENKFLKFWQDRKIF